MEQSFLNWLFGIANLALGAFLKWIYDAHKELRDADEKLTEKVNKIEVQVAGKYITRDEFERAIQRIFDKLDHIEMKIQK
jgi:undecaprenyl pyrophosphate synthase